MASVKLQIEVEEQEALRALGKLQLGFAETEDKIRKMNRTSKQGADEAKDSFSGLEGTIFDLKGVAEEAKGVFLGMFAFDAITGYIEKYRELKKEMAEVSRMQAADLTDVLARSGQLGSQQTIESQLRGFQSPLNFEQRVETFGAVAEAFNGAGSLDEQLSFTERAVQKGGRIYKDPKVLAKGAATLKRLYGDAITEEQAFNLAQTIIERAPKAETDDEVGIFEDINEIGGKALSLPGADDLPGGRKALLDDIVAAKIEGTQTRQSDNAMQSPIDTLAEDGLTKLESYSLPGGIKGKRRVQVVPGTEGMTEAEIFQKFVRGELNDEQMRALGGDKAAQMGTIRGFQEERDAVENVSPTLLEDRVAQAEENRAQAARNRKLTAEANREALKNERRIKAAQIEADRAERAETIEKNIDQALVESTKPMNLFGPPVFTLDLDLTVHSDDSLTSMDISNS